MLPCNGGGSLVNESGKCWGVNTLKVFKGSIASAGFGIAIPKALTLSEFAQQLSGL